jgi:magnesium transporter
MAKVISSKKSRLGKSPGFDYKKKKAKGKKRPAEDVEKTPVFVLQWLTAGRSFQEFQTHQDSLNDLLQNHLSKGPADQYLWLDLQTTTDFGLLQTLAESLNLHPLTLEDLLNTNHRPKVEHFDRYSFCVLKMLRPGQNPEQMNILVFPNLVVTVQERPGDVFEGIRERFRTGQGRVRDRGADYLFFALLDAMVDNYILTVEDLGDNIEDHEDQVFDESDASVFEFIRGAKKKVAEFRRFTKPVREMVEQLQKTDIFLSDEKHLFTNDTLPFLQDLKDHIGLVTEALDTYREMLSDQLSLHTGLQSHRLNGVMKVLTIISTIFIPITFLAGIYGMNFDFMPELGFPWAYPVVLGIMAVLILTMLIIFWRKGWIGKKKKR